MGAKKYTDELADEIVQRIANGETLRAITRDEHMPSWRTVYDWIESKPELAARIARARELGFDAIAEDALRIADTTHVGEVREESEAGVKIKTEDMLGHRKLQVWTRLQLLAKWAPKKYGDKQAIDLNANVAVSSLTDEEILAELSLLKPAIPAPDGGDLV